MIRAFCRFYAKHWRVAWRHSDPSLPMWEYMAERVESFNSLLWIMMLNKVVILALFLLIVVVYLSGRMLFFPA